MIAVQDAASAVTEALRARDALADGERVLQVTQLAGGWSRHSHVATSELLSGERRRYVIRVRPGGALLDTDLGLEYRIYEALDDVDVPTPRVYAFVEDAENPFGGPFIVMEHIDGRAPNTYDWGDQQWLAADFDDGRSIAEDRGATLAGIHALAGDRLPVGLPSLEFAGVVARWREVYETRRLIRDPVIEEAFAWVSHREPREPWIGLVHGDYRIGNTLVYGGRVRAILDWELCYRGDVRFDLGYLAMPRSSGKHLVARSPLMGAFADQGWFMDRYAQLTGRAFSVDDLATFQMLGIMMLLATQLTASWMYARGRTTDVRMAWSRFSFAGLRQDMTKLMGW